MEIVRRTLGTLFAILGTYYCILAVFTLARLPGVTSDWIARSGDPDFKHDYGLFMAWIAVGSVLTGALGYRSAVKGIRAARGRRESWLVLALGAPLLHWFWFLFRIVGTGALDREAQEMARRSNALWFGVICVGYVVMWIVMRHGSGSRSSEITRQRMRPNVAAGH